MSKFIEIININEVPQMGSRVLEIGELEIAIFKTRENKIFAINNVCPHKQGKLSEGIVHDENVTCPLHNWVIDFNSGEAQGSDTGCTNTYEIKIENEIVFIKL
jgi:nitrite reductase (NADH) small subunit